MSARSTMRHRCTIERDTGSSGTGPWNTPGRPDWQPHLTGQPCHLWFTAGRRQITPGQDTATSALRLIVPVSTDVTDDDRIGQVTDRAGRVLLTGPVLIDTVGRRADHLVLYLKEEQG